jgi:hypothetical protein
MGYFQHTCAARAAETLAIILNNYQVKQTQEVFGVGVRHHSSHSGMRVCIIDFYSFSVST